MLAGLQHTWAWAIMIGRWARLTGLPKKNTWMRVHFTLGFS